MTGSASEDEGREAGKDRDKTHELIYVRPKDWNLVILIIRKVVPHLWGKSVGPGSFPLLRAILGGHRNVHRQSQSTNKVMQLQWFYFPGN